MDSNDPLTRMVYIAMAAVAGAVTALSLMDWQRMPLMVRAMTIFVGTSFAIFAVPLLVSLMPKIWTGALPFEKTTLQVACGLTYFGGTFANAAIPLIWKKIKKRFGLDESETVQ